MTQDQYLILICSRPITALEVSLANFEEDQMAINPPARISVQKATVLTVHLPIRPLHRQRSTGCLR
jgi:hypothetical protein